VAVHGQGTPGVAVAGLTTKAGVGAGFLAGFGCMAAELTAVRLLAPHFGDSAYVWTNVIGVILAALACGAWFGGRAANRLAVGPCAAWICTFAGAAIAAAPWLAPTLGGWFVPADLPLDAAMPAMILGSFAATLALFAPAMLALGAVTPLLVTGIVRGGGDVGRASGAMSAAGTLGSLVGTFAATHWLVPATGCRATLAIAGAFLVVGGAIVALPRARKFAAAAALVVGATAAAPHGPLRHPAGGERLVAEVESRVQYLQVLRTDSAPARTRLAINEGLDSFHSLAIDGSSFTAGAYYDWHALVPFLAGDGRRPDGLKALSVGDAAGTLRRVYAAVHPGVAVDAVDVDAEAMALGDAHFAGPKAAGRRFVIDGRVFLAHATERWHAIHVDAYAHQVYIPAHLASVEFFRAVHDRLESGGVVACNVGALRRDDPVLARIAASCRQVFGHALALLLPSSRNALLLARRDGVIAPATLPAAAAAGDHLASADDAAAWRSLVAAAAEGAWFEAGLSSEALVDEQPLLDLLLARSYLDRGDPSAVTLCAGKAAPNEAEMAAYLARQRRDWSGVLAAVADSRDATPYLRELAGDARWSLRQLRAADAEYAAAASTADPAAAARLGGKQRDLALDFAALVRAEAAAANNGLFALALTAALAGAVGLAAWRRSRPSRAAAA
jgi:spermidine synthase